MTLPSNAGAPVDDKPEEAPAPKETVFNEDSEKDYKAGHAAPPTSPPAEGQAEQVESVDTPAETAPPEPSPETETPAAPEPIVDSPELVQLRQQNAQLQQQQQQAQQAQNQQYAAQQLQQLVDQRVAQEIAELTPIHGEEIARQLGERHKATYTQMGQMQQQAQQQMAGYQAKVDLAGKIAERDGSSFQRLMQESTPQGMENVSRESKIIRDLQEDAAKAKRATVPAQKISDGQTSAKSASGDAALLNKYTELGFEALSKSEQDRVTKMLS